MVGTGPGTPPRTIRLLRYAALGAAVIAVLGLTVVLLFDPSGATPTTGQATAPTGRQLHVDPAGSDSNDGTTGAPFQTIQAALDEAQPGDTITLAPGRYSETLGTRRDGRPDAPITIRGPETGTDRADRYRAVVYSPTRTLNVDNSHYVFEGFTIDGQEELADTPYPDDLATIDRFKDSVRDKVSDSRLIYVGSADDVRDVTGVTIRNMFLSGAGGECVRLRNNANGITVTDSVIQYCGMYGKGGNRDRTEYHNGEGVYIGTSPKSDNQPMYDNDESRDNVVSNNVIRTFGSECFNVKENAHGNRFEGNTCSDNAESADFDGSNVELRGYQNIVRDNVISDSTGYGVKIQSDDERYDLGGNTVENNRISGTAVEPLKIKVTAPLGPICGNALEPGLDDDELVETEDYSGDPTAPCVGGGAAPGSG